ncbi:GntR family transcriptional regulator [Afipia sp. TerB]
MKPRTQRAAAAKASPELVVERFAPEQTFKTRAYEALKQAILGMEIYASPEPTWIDERQLSEQLGVSRTPVREAIVMLEHEGLVKSVPRKGVMVLKKTKREVIDMIQAWAALESMAARLATLHASDEDIAGLRGLFQGFNEGHKPADHLSEYSSANLQFHQTIVKLSGSQVLVDMTEQILLHVRGIRQITIGRDDRATRSMVDHLAIIDAIEKRDTERAMKLSRDHTLGLADYVEAHSEGILE